LIKMPSEDLPTPEEGEDPSGDTVAAKPSMADSALSNPGRMEQKGFVDGGGEETAALAEEAAPTVDAVSYAT
jgi:hypothetical protein